jgi:hypothetical protein
MRVSFDASDFTRETQQINQLKPQIRRGMWVRVREVSFNVERYVKIAMPVDIGRARASWGHSTAPASPGDGIWNETERDLTIEQGSNVEYIEALNNGHSRQAPAGFIDAIERRGAEELTNKIADDLARLF